MTKETSEQRAKRINAAQNAKQKFEQIHNAFKELQSEFNCSIDSFCQEDDLLGCCLQVSFEMDGFDFCFTLTD